MRTRILAILIVFPFSASPNVAQQATPNQHVQTEADKGIKTHNSGASGYVGDQYKPGSAAHAPGDASHAGPVGDATSSPRVQNSGAGIASAPGGKNGPSPQQDTVGSSLQNQSIQEQDSANVKGLPGNKSGPPAKR